MRRRDALLQFLLDHDQNRIVHADKRGRLTVDDEVDEGDELLTDLLTHTHATLEAQNG